MFDVDTDLVADDIVGQGFVAFRCGAVDQRFHLTKPDRRPILERSMTALRTPIYNMI